MVRNFVSTAVAFLASAPVALAGELIEKTSPYPVSETIDRLETAVTGAGATIFARVDHGAGAASVDLELPPSELLIFGNPKLGTPAMQDGPTAGVVRVVYHAPSSLAAAHGLPADAKYIQTMTGALDKLTGAAVASE